MVDREDVIESLEIVKRRVGRLNGFGEEAEVIGEAINLLKAHEPIEPDVDVDVWRCGNCGHVLEHQEMIGNNILFHEQYAYCPNCGRPVKWE